MTGLIPPHIPPLFQPPGFLQTYCQNDANTIEAQVIVAFSLSVILSPWSLGFFFFLIFLIIYEIIYAWGCQMEPKYWSYQGRITVILASIFGFILGRTVIGAPNLLGLPVW